MDFRCPELCPFGERLPYLIAIEAFVAVYHGFFMENWITQRRRTICSHESWTLGAYFHILLHFQSADFLLARRKCEWDKIMPLRALLEIQIIETFGRVLTLQTLLQPLLFAMIVSWEKGFFGIMCIM